MKKIFALSVAIIFSVNVFSQAPVWLWEKTVGGAGMDESWDIASDGNGSAYIAGFFSSSSITFGTITLNNAGGVNVFIAKYNSFGNVLWARSAGGSGGDDAYGIATDVNGNVYVTGKFSSPSITFGSITLNNISDYDFFIAKYDSAGNALWAKVAGGNSDDRGYGLAADANGNVFVTGIFTSSSITFGVTTLTNPAGYSDLFIVKYDSAGNVLWAKKAGGNKFDFALRDATDGNGNVYVTGWFDSDSISFGTTTLVNAHGGNHDFFIVKYDSAGNVLWAKRAGTTSDDAGLDVATDASGNAFVSGYFGPSSVSFGPITLNNTGSSDGFLVKYDTGGNVAWAKAMGGLDYDINTGVSIDAAGNAFVSGSFFSSVIIFGTDSLLNTSTSFNDVFVAKYNSAGNLLWKTKVGGSADEYSPRVAYDQFGNVYVTGYFYSPVISFGTDDLYNMGFDDIFLAKLEGGAVTAMENIAYDKEITISPNPATNEIKIQSAEFKVESVEIYDVMGEKLPCAPLSSRRGAGGEVIDVSSLASGIYFLRIFSASGIVTKKFVKTN